MEPVVLAHTGEDRQSELPPAWSPLMDPCFAAGMGDAVGGIAEGSRLLQVVSS